MGIEVLELELTIIRGDGLAAKDSNIFGMKKKSDPYVEVRLCPWGPLQGEDKKILVGITLPKMKTLSPRWDETFITSLPVQQFSEFAAFELKIFDYDKHNEDDPMGTILVKVPLFVQDETETKWHRVPATCLEGVEATGRLECTMKTKKKVLRPGEEPKAYKEAVIPAIHKREKKAKMFKVPKALRSRAEQAKMEEEAISAATRGAPKADMVELDITVTRAKGLAAMDTNLLGMKAKSDPYIVVRLCPQGHSQGNNKVYVGKTPTIMKTLDPVWTEKNNFSVSLPKTRFNRFAMFELTIWDYDKSNEDDIMGVVPVPVKLDRPGTTTKWYKVPAFSAGGAGARGDVECILSIKSGEREHSVSHRTVEDVSMNVEESLRKRMSTVPIRRVMSAEALPMPTRVDIIEMQLVVTRARGLAAMDNNVVGMSTTSDPYVVVKLCAQGPSQPDDTKIKLGQTPPVFKSLNPSWNRAFNVSLLKKDLTQFAIFELTIWDFDDHNEDDLMGTVFVKIPMASSGKVRKWHPVPPNSGEQGLKATGEVECVLKTKRIQRVAGTEPEDAPKRPNYKGPAEEATEEIPASISILTEGTASATSEDTTTASRTGADVEGQGDNEQSASDASNAEKVDAGDCPTATASNYAPVEAASERADSEEGKCPEKVEPASTAPTKGTSPGNRKSKRHFGMTSTPAKTGKSASSSKSKGPGQGSSRSLNSEGASGPRKRGRLGHRRKGSSSTRLDDDEKEDQKEARSSPQSRKGLKKKGSSTSLDDIEIDEEEGLSSQRRQPSKTKGSLRKLDDAEDDGQDPIQRSSSRGTKGGKKKGSSTILDDIEIDEEEGPPPESKKKLKKKGSSKKLDDAKDDGHDAIQRSSWYGTKGRRKKGSSNSLDDIEIDEEEGLQPQGRKKLKKKGSSKHLDDAEQDAIQRSSSSNSTKGLKEKGSSTSLDDIEIDEEEGQLPQGRKKLKKKGPSKKLDNAENNGQEAIQKSSSHSSTKGLKKKVSTRKLAEGSSPPKKSSPQPSKRIKKGSSPSEVGAQVKTVSSNGKKNTTKGASQSEDGAQVKRVSSNGKKSTKKGSSHGEKSAQVKRISSSGKKSTKMGLGQVKEADFAGSSRRKVSRAKSEKLNQKPVGKEKSKSPIRRTQSTPKNIASSGDEKIGEAKPFGSPTSVEQSLGPEDVQQKRMKVCDIYEKWEKLKVSKTALDRQNSRMMPFADQ